MSSISTIKARFAKAWTGMTARMKLSVPLAFAAAAVLMALSPSQASAETRSLKLYYVHTGEKAEIVFKRNGRFDAQGLKKLNVFLRDWRRNEPTKMDPRLFDLVWQIYRATGSSQYITVVSAYRSPATNAMLRSTTRGVAKKSQHMLGRAMDFFIPGVPLAKLRAIGMRFQIGGVGYYPRSGSPFVHMDVGNVRSWPRMSRRELLALFPDGKTAHIPADGKPLPGYKQALAMIEKRKASGSEIVVASNSAPRRSKSLLGALFGGGADEEEDNSDVSAPAKARPARAVPARQTPKAPAQQSPETMIAALPAREAPVPVQAPRPETGLNAQAQAAAEAPVVALNVPIPASKPAMAAQDAVALAAAEPAADAAEANTVQLADAGTPSPLMNGFVPIPSARPQLETDNVQLAAAVIPSARPARADETPVASGQDAIAALVNSEEAEPTQLAMLSGKDEIGELIAPPSDDYYDGKPVAETAPQQAPAQVQTASVARTSPTSTPAKVPAAVQKKVAAIGNAAETGVRTTAKGARYAAKARSKPRAVVQPAVIPSSEVAISTEPVSRTVPVTNPVLRNDALRSAPAMVYTAGFQRGDLPTERANEFSGSAVTFLTVAKFTATN